MLRAKSTSYMRRQLSAFIEAAHRQDWSALQDCEITAKDYNILMQYIPRPEQRLELTRRLAGQIVDLKTNMRMLLESNPFATEKEELRRIFQEHEQQIQNFSFGCSFSRRSLINSRNTSKLSMVRSISTSLAE